MKPSRKLIFNLHASVCASGSHAGAQNNIKTLYFVSKLTNMILTH